VCTSLGVTRVCLEKIGASSAQSLLIKSTRELKSEASSKWWEFETERLGTKKVPPSTSFCARGLGFGARTFALPVAPKYDAL
jgi:hypothetical protein